MKVLLIGSGGREHAMAWKISQSPQLSELIMAPGSDAMARFGACKAVPADNVPALVELAKCEKIDLVVVGPENALAEGLADQLQAHDILVFGPSQVAAQLEASKAFTKDFCAQYGIPTAASTTVSSPAEAHLVLAKMSPPFVLKADGLAAGKGVVIVDDLAAAKVAATNMLEGQFGNASAKLVIEEFLTGEEASLFVLCDGKTAKALTSAQDHKRAFDGDTGPNTGGMGCYSPAPIMDAGMTDRVMREIVGPTLEHMQAQNMPFCGVLYAGLMIDDAGPKLIEYNVRFGDPEAQVLMRRLTSDLLPVLLACAKGELADQPALQWRANSSACVVFAAKGYPGKAPKGSAIKQIEAAAEHPAVEIFHAGTKSDTAGNWVANGGRVLNITANGADLSSTVALCYAAIAKIDWPQGFYRKDIGWRAL